MENVLIKYPLFSGAVCIQKRKLNRYGLCPVKVFLKSHNIFDKLFHTYGFISHHNVFSRVRKIDYTLKFCLQIDVAKRILHAIRFT